MKRRTLLTLSLLIILWLATALRFYRLDVQSFWNDEGNSARLSERSIALIVEGTASDIHPPLYYLLLHGWRQLLGESEFALRALSTFAGLTVVAATIALARRLFHAQYYGHLPSILAGLFAAVNPALIYYSQEARMYELLVLWAVLSTLLLLGLLARISAQQWRSFTLVAAAYVLTSAAGLYTHYFFPAILVAHNLLVAVWLVRSRQRAFANRFLWRWIVMMVAAFLLYLPWVPIFWRQAGGRPGDATPAFSFLRDAARWLTLEPVAIGVAPTWILVPFALLALLGSLPDKQAESGGRRAHGLISPRAAILLPLVVPILFMLLADTTRPAYFKFMLVSVPFVALLLARGVLVGWQAYTRSRPWQGILRLLSLSLFFLALYGSAVALKSLYFDPTLARDDYRGIAAYIEAAEHSNAGIILNAANQWEVFTYYHRDGEPVYPIPRGQPDEARIAAELSNITARHDRLYALYWGADERDPQHLVERWLDAHAFKATERWVGDVRFVTYALPPEPAETMEITADVTFGEQITLLGYTLRNQRLAAGDIVQVSLFWRAETALDERYKVFLHLLDQQGALVAQRDAEPGGNLALTTSWQPGQVIQDNHGVLVPLETPPGEYELRLGLYPLQEPHARLSVGASQDGSDSYSLGAITVR